MHIITRLDMGGSAQNTLLTCRELAGKYRTVLVHGLARESRMTAAEKATIADACREAVYRGVKFIPVPSLVRPIRPFRDLWALLSIFWHIWVERPDIVHTHTSKAGILGRLAARLSGVPHIVHTPHGHVFNGHFGRAVSRIFLVLERFCARFTHRLVALTERERQDYLDRDVGRPQHTPVIHSGVDIDAFCAGGTAAVKREALGLDPLRPIVGFVGWLLPIKGPMHLLRAMASVWPRHPQALLVFIGKGDQEDELRREARRIGADERVRFLGWREDVAEIMPVFDIFVLPSLNEGMGRVLVEAMAAGRPIVASAAGGIPDLVRHEETGLLVPPRDEGRLAAAISRLLASPEESGRLGANGLRSCRRFGLDRMITRLEALYEGLLHDPALALAGKTHLENPQRPGADRKEVACGPDG
jgi:glycosyltransferase involved in cell wall biosynthesis